MNIKHLRITTIRPFMQSKRVEGKKVNYRGMEVIAYTPINTKVKFTSNMLFELPLLNEKEQTKALIEDVSGQVLVREKELDKFYSGLLK
tara:strand:+ start:1102 stop:1368 length:267 start_codon:yes stop_codon:yes gene_type:complete